MERRDWILSCSIIFLGLTILISSYWISNSLSLGSEVTSNGLSNLGVSLNNAMYQPMNSKIEIKDKDKDKEILNISETEQFLGITGGEMYKIMDDIPHVSIGNKYLYSKRSLIDWVEKSNYGVELK